MQKMWVQPLGQVDHLKKEMATHSNSFAWEISDRGAWQATMHGVTKESDVT